MELESVVDGPVAKLVIAGALLAICVVIHAVGLVGLDRLLRGQHQKRRNAFREAWFLIRVAWWLILLHLVEISIWAGFYAGRGCLPDLGTSFYFSSITYTTVGYGDVVLPPEWRNLSSVEALTGILMAGLSTGFFFMLLSRTFNPSLRDR